MAVGDNFNPSSAAIRLTHWLDAAEAAGLERFPVAVDKLALDVGQTLKWPDPIVEVRAANLPMFEGGLFHIKERRGWALLYNEQLGSPGRVRFTQAHELGHYLLHRQQQEAFECSEADMVHWGPNQKALESQADEFASNLLMPMKQFRVCMTGHAIDFEMLSEASTKFGVSLTATCLRWILSTEESAVLVLSRDGFIDWSVSSDKARMNGAFIRTRGRVVELPMQSLAAEKTMESCRLGRRVSLNTWFEHAHPDAVAREMKLVCDNYGYTLSLLHLSRGDKVWAPREWGV
ncbi:ImmA/IrrE family metallo-endopeptidase [Polaromonas sp. JS666]|uniref:ImmA/IrrE family metallo-endopeptidase n=1 Tax=Polaromonas sp. (strain JS666 / ATCC BAA-500) TaxID=296591 RepID=UPI00059EBBB3|nr:ImmA/IrrE family metallo-endopeptidase [Polaromonas sp. JS666]